MCAHKLHFGAIGALREYKIPGTWYITARKMA